MNPLVWLNPGRWLLYLTLAAALVAGYFAWQTHERDIGRAEIRSEYAKEAAAANTTRAAITPPIVQKEAAAQAQIRTVTKTIIKEVPTYVKDTDCPVPGGFRVLYDAAAHGVIPDPSGIADAAPAALADVASTTVENFGTYHEVAERLTALQEWVRAQASAK